MNRQSHIPEDLQGPDLNLSHSKTTEQKSLLAELEEINIARSRSNIYTIINGERDYQDEIWGPSHDRNHEVEAYVLYMEDYLQEARKNLSRNGGVEKGLDALRKVVALGVACFESHGVPERKI